MSSRSHNGHRDEALDDATVEELLDGRYNGDAPDLLAMNKLFTQVRSLGEHPAPLPSASLAPLLRDAPPTNVRLPTTGRRLPRDLRVGPLRRSAQGPQPTPTPWHRPRVSRAPIVAAGVSAVVAVVVVAAGSARLLPGPTQNVVARIMRTVTPFDFPDQQKPQSVLSKAPRPGTRPPSEEPASRFPGDPWLHPLPEPGTSGDRAVGPDSPGSASQPRGVNARPTPATTLAGGNTGSPPGVTTSVPSAPPRDRLRAELTGATGAEEAGDPDGRATATLSTNPGRDELCLTLVVSGVAPVTAVHLHSESSGVGGPDVAAWTGATGECVTGSDELIKDIRRQPEKYYVDLHTTEFPSGALRGPLAK